MNLVISDDAIKQELEVGQALEKHRLVPLPAEVRVGADMNS